MERWEVTERVCAVELYSDGVNYRGSAWICREQHKQEARSSNAVRRWVRQWREEGSARCKKARCRPFSVRTPDNIARVLASVSRSPRRSARKNDQALRLSDRRVRRILSSPIQIASSACFK
jgi:transposase